MLDRRRHSLWPWPLSLTLCKNEVILLDEALECVRLEVVYIRCRSQGGSSEESESGEVAHCDFSWSDVNFQR